MRSFMIDFSFQYLQFLREEVDSPKCKILKAKAIPKATEKEKGERATSSI